MPKVKPELIDKETWGLIILHADNGFMVKTLPDKNVVVFADKDGTDESHISAAKELFWFVIEHFNINPSRYAKERLCVHTEAGDKYEPKSGEKLKKEFYYVVVKK